MKTTSRLVLAFVSVLMSASALMAGAAYADGGASVSPSSAAPGQTLDLTFTVQNTASHYTDELYLQATGGVTFNSSSDSTTVLNSTQYIIHYASPYTAPGASVTAHINATVSSTPGTYTINSDMDNPAGADATGSVTITVAAGSFTTSVSPSTFSATANKALTVTYANTTGQSLDRLTYGFDAAGLNYISSDCPDASNGDGVVTITPPDSGSCTIHVDGSTPGDYSVSVHARLNGTTHSETPLAVHVTAASNPLSGTISGIAGGVSPSAFWSSSAPVFGLLAVAVIVVFSLSLIGGAVSGLGKGKGKISGGYGAGPERTDLVDGIKSGKYHG